MKIKNYLIKQAGLSLMSFAALTQLNAQQTFEAEAFIESAYATVTDAELFSGGKYVTMNAAYGSYVKYIITAEAAGTYDFAIDYATMNGRSMYVKAENYLPVIAVFDTFTGSWDGSEGTGDDGNPLAGIMTLTVPVYLNAGENEVEIGAFDGQDGSFSPNFDKFTVSPSAATTLPTLSPAALSFEAENARIISADINDATCYSGGKGIFNIGASSKIQFENINVAEEGTYNVVAYYTTFSERNFTVKANNYLPVTMACKIGLPYWTCPENEEQENDPTRPTILKKTVQVYFNAGSNTLTFSSFQGNPTPNLDKIEIVKSGLNLPKPGYEIMAAVFDFTDNVANFATDFVEEYATDSANLSRLIDNNEYTTYIKEGVSETKITAKTAYPIILTGYAIAGIFGQPGKLPDDWTLEYSDDGNTWNPVANVGAIDTDAYRSITTGYNLDNLVSAQYFRLTATGNGKVEIGEWQLFGVPYISAEQAFPNDDMTHNVPFDEILSYSMGDPDGFDRGGGWNEVFENVFDKQLNTVYTVVDGKNFYIQFETPDLVTLKSYALTGRFGFAPRSPSKWKIEALSEKTSDWVLLDTRENIKFPADASTLMFNIKEPVESFLYKLTVEDTAGEGTANLVQWQMFKDWYGISPSPNAINNVTCHFPVTVASRKGSIQLYTTSAANLPFTLFDLLGKQIESGVCHPGITEIRVGSGVYIIRVGEAASKIVVK
ncbi:MAG: hypothetical protein LBP72_09300 [Dysgonamonadaceae bacterium]|jgi:hypothetical protein|nr:hypothetical protein [Dysgonamonadaceae bacterium]